MSAHCCRLLFCVSQIFFFFFQAEDGIRDLVLSRGLGDVYKRQVLYLPAVGVLMSGDYASNALPPRILPGSDGSEELETLRLLARLIKSENFQLCVPRVGATVREKPAVMERLAGDVAYLHGLRRVIPGLIKRGEPLETIEVVAESLLPDDRRSEVAQRIHDDNVQALTGIFEESPTEQ